MKRPKPVLLDTNALIAIPREGLAAAQAAKTYSFRITPWTFFERLCRLDDGDFAKNKPILMKAELVEIVDKPLDRLVAERQQGLAPRVWGSDLAKAYVRELSGVTSKADFGGLTMTDEAGEARSLERSIETIRGILDREKRRFQKLVADIIDLIRAGSVPTATPAERHIAVLDMLVAGASSFRDVEGLDHEANTSHDEVLTFEYVYYAYIMLRAIAQYGAGGSTCARNDFVDGQICAYIPLDQPIAVLTEDRVLRETLEEISALLTAVGMGNRARFCLLDLQSLGPGTRVRGTDDRAN